MHRQLYDIRLTFPANAMISSHCVRIKAISAEAAIKHALNKVHATNMNGGNAVKAIRAELAY